MADDTDAGVDEGTPGPAEPSFGPADSAFDPDFDAAYDVPAEKPAPAAKPGEKKPAEGKAGDKKPAEKTPEPAAPRHDPYIVRQAKRFGATQEWIDSQDPDYLEAEVHRAIAASSAPRPEPKKDEPKDDVIEFEHGGRKHSIKAGDYDESVVALFRSLQAQNEAVQKELREHRESAGRRHQDDQREAAAEAFAELGEVFTAEGQDAHGRRVMMVRAAGIVADDTPARVRSKIKAAAAALGLSAAKSPPAAKAAPAKSDSEQARDPRNGQFVRTDDAEAEVENWRTGGLPEPTERQPPPPPRLSHRDQGIKNLAANMRKHGLMPHGGA